MILRFKNLGIIEAADIDIAKPFIVFTGPNGTGKTYLSYVMEDLTSSFGGFLLSYIKKSENKSELYRYYDPSQFESVDEINGILDAEMLYDLFKKGLAFLSNDYLTSLNLKDDEEHPFSMEIVSSLDEWKEELLQMKLEGGFFLKHYKEKGALNYRVVAIPEYRTREKEKNESDFEWALFFASIFFHGSPSATMFTAERSGISLFSKELAVGRLKADPSSIPRYPRAISRGLSDAEDRAYYSRQRGDFSDLADTIEKKILRGKIKVTKEGELKLSRDKNDYDIAVASSTTKALADVVFYIRHRARRMSRLIIDEPEIHLHPDNQLLLAKVFTRMVNRGLQLVISTHSEYIIRELNNLIMLKYVGEDFVKTAKKMGYNQDEFLDSELIQPYLFVLQDNGRVRTEPVIVKKDGFAIKSIDTAIAGLNDVAEEVYYAMLQNQ